MCENSSGPNEKYALVEHYNKINHTINHTLHLTHRIKFTCFDVSSTYIIFGATSGGLYVFTREPCTFLKLIPSKEGCLSDVSISPDEKTIALGSVKGSISLVNCFNKEASYVNHVYHEHQGNKITCMKWNALSDELYSGDVSGKISVIVLSNFLSKTLFQASSATLMKLDSSIVQIDTFVNYLIVSSLTRSYLCDTEREYFRQIGKKLRDDPYGACFYNSKQFEPCKVTENSHIKGVFRILKDEENFTVTNNEDVRIFCIRPGFRIWEVNMDSSVARTHQFKDFVKNKPCSIIRISEKSDSHLQLLSSTKEYTIHDCNFGKVYTLSDKFLLTFSTNVLFIFNALTLSLLYWTNYYCNIVDVKIINNFIYIINEKFEIKILSVSTIESLVISATMNKQYTACAELCINFKEDIMKAITKNSEKFSMLLVLEDNLKKSEKNGLYEKVLPILNEIRKSKFTNVKKLKNGIFVVKNNHALTSSIDLEGSNDTAASIGDTNNFERPKSIVDMPKEKEYFQIIERQLNIKSVNDSISYPPFLNLIIEIADFNKIVELFLEYENSMKDRVTIKESLFIEYLQYLNNCPNCESIINNFQVNCVAENYLLEGFVHLNNNISASCECNFPLPNAYKTRPKFLEVGEICLRKIYKINHDKGLEIVKKVPFLWNILIELKEIESEQIMNFLLQYSDIDVLKKYVSKFSQDNWKEAIKLLSLVKQGKCINCNKIYEHSLVKYTLDWSKFSLIMFEKMGTKETIKILLENHRYIAKGQLDAIFYQTILLDTMQKNKESPNEVLEFMENVYTKPDTVAQFENILANCLNSKFNKGSNKLMNNLTTSSCVHCLLPVLSEEAEKDLVCRHVHHKVCLRLNKNKCVQCHVIL